jgi:ribosome-associated protein YbcJ (S4-like RNA binding protein)
MAHTGHVAAQSLLKILAVSQRPPSGGRAKVAVEEVRRYTG